LQVLQFKNKQFFWCSGKKTFAASLPPFGISLAALWREFCRVLVPSTNKQSAVQKSVAFSLEGAGDRSLS